MRILFLAPQPFYSPRGTPIAVRALLQVLGQDGHHVDLVTYAEGQDVDLPNVTTHRIPKRLGKGAKVPIGPSLEKLPRSVGIYRLARRLLRTKRYDVIHGVEDGAILAWLLSRRNGLPFVFDMDSHMSAQLVEKSPLLWPAAQVFSILERGALRRAAGVLAVCPALAEVAARDRDPATVQLLPDMPLFDGEAVEPSEEIRALGGTRIVYVGNLEAYQGIDLLVEGFGLIADRHPDATLVVVGGNDESVRRYRASISGMAGQDRVHFLGPRPLSQLGSVLAAGHILASPRLKGVNTPMKIYSYLESGRAVVATRLTTHTQVLDDEVAVLVEAEPADLAEGLSSLLSQPDFRDELGKRGREYVRSEFGEEKFRERVRRFYSELLPVSEQGEARDDIRSGDGAPRP